MGYQTRYSGIDPIAAVYAGIPAHTAHPLSFANTTGVNAANDTLFSRVLAGYTPAATAIRLSIANTSGNLCVAVYSDNNGLPGTRLATSGSVASPGNGSRSIALDVAVAVRPGMWLSVSADNTTITFARGGAPAGTGAFGAKFQAKQTSAFPAPATAAASNDWRAELILIAE